MFFKSVTNGVRFVSALIGVIVAGSTLAGCGGGNSGPSVPSTVVDKIAFVSDRDGNKEIYIMNADGSGQTRITNNAADDYSPALSRDGNKIVFVSTRDGNPEIYVTDSSGQRVLRLTNSSQEEGSPSLSDNGSKIAFIRSNTVYVMAGDGSDEKIVAYTHSILHPSQAQISPDGNQVVFTRDTMFGGCENGFCFDSFKRVISLINIGTGEATSLTNDNAFNYSPAFSRDGSKIAFERDGDLFIMNADGTAEPKRLTQNSYSPSFGSTGKIAFSSNRDGNREIYLINPDGTNETRLTANPSNEDEPSWR